MRLSDHIHQSLSNLWKKKLRTFLTTAGVVIGIAALFSMLAFGKGMQKNITDRFTRLDLFRYITVFGPSEGPRRPRGPRGHRFGDSRQTAPSVPPLDDSRLAEIAKLPGVQAVFPEVRFPAVVRRDDNERFTLAQVVSPELAASGLVTFLAGGPYTHADPNAIIVSDSILRDLGLTDPQAAVGQSITIATITLNGPGSPGFNPLDFIGAFTGDLGDALPFAQKEYALTIAGVAERMGVGMASPLRSDVFIAPQAADGMQKMNLTNVRDLFKSPDQLQAYSTVSIRLVSAEHVDTVTAAVEAWGYRTFAIADEIDEIKTAFVLMDMFLAAIGMIALLVASLGIVNTMVMATLERYREIGIMKAVGARNSDVRRIFFFESGAIGLLGGLLGVTSGWLTSLLINRIVNYYLAAKGIPYTEYFNFPVWLWLASIAFAIAISLAAGLYPAIRAAKTDPIKALRHD
ncbi:MAG: ABC transporter permease [Phycisphaerae bacterium]|nr:ABC transporter permease [Phycisphaerae bacterium]